MSKCSGCDQHNAVIYDDEDMYCHDCYNEKKEIEEEWFPLIYGLIDEKEQDNENN